MQKIVNNYLEEYLRDIQANGKLYFSIAVKIFVFYVKIFEMIFHLPLRLAAHRTLPHPRQSPLPLL